MVCPRQCLRLRMSVIVVSVRDQESGCSSRTIPQPALLQVGGRHRGSYLVRRPVLGQNGGPGPREGLYEGYWCVRRMGGTEAAGLL